MIDFYNQDDTDLSREKKSWKDHRYWQGQNVPGRCLACRIFRHILMESDVCLLFLATSFAWHTSSSEWLTRYHLLNDVYIKKKQNKQKKKRKQKKTVVTYDLDLKMSIQWIYLWQSFSDFFKNPIFKEAMVAGVKWRKFFFEGRES